MTVWAQRLREAGRWWLLAASLVGMVSYVPPLPSAPTTTLPSGLNDCRFGLTVVYGFADYDVQPLTFGSYLNWGLSANPALPRGGDYIQMVRLKDNLFPTALAQIPTVAKARPGSYWLVGNEPDTQYGQGEFSQDNLTPTIYAQRYYSAYTTIKSHDPLARVAIGGLVQPTAVRREYLDRVFAAYRTRYGTLPPSDFWHMHGFLLNEVHGQWGTGMPRDYLTKPYAAAPEVLDAYDDSDRIDLFETRLRAFREWMARNGQRDKPLWITEYGVLMPTWVIPIKRTDAYMLNSFNWLRSASDPNTGYPSDDNHLVQRWYWWTLGEDPSNTGGGLYDRRIISTSITTTAVVVTPTILYTSAANYSANLTPYIETALRFYLTPTVQAPPFTTTIVAEVANLGNLSITQPFSVSFYAGHPAQGGTLIAAKSFTQDLTGCGRAIFKTNWQVPVTVPTGANPQAETPIVIWVQIEGLPAEMPGQRSASMILFPRQIYLPFIQR